MSKIFVRERTRIGKGDGVPRLAIVGVEGSGLKIFQVHVRQSELEAIAQAVGAEIVMLPRGTGKNAGDGSGGGQRQKQSASRKTESGE